MNRKLPPSAYVEQGRSTAPQRPHQNVFGTVRARQWRVPAHGSERDMHAARLQHDLATALRDAIARDDAGKIAEFVRRHPEFTYDRLRGILSGDMWMRLDDITELARLLGLTVRIEFNPTDSNRDSGNRSLALDDATGR